jgi:hypothetical protein
MNQDQNPGNFSSQVIDLDTSNKLIDQPQEGKQHYGKFKRNKR